MPPLQQEPDVYPADLFTGRDDGSPWWVAHVASRQEKVLARFLHERRVSFYLPLGRKSVVRGGRTRTSYLPLFPGYVFVKGEGEARMAALRSGVVVNALKVGDQGTLREELAQVRRLQESGASFVPWPELGSGDAVKITDGVFRGCRGTVVREKGSERLVVTVTFLRQSIVAELGRSALVPARIA